MFYILIGKLAIFVSRLMGNRGTNVGGSVVTKFTNKSFSKLSKNIDKVIIITGTNGKSTVTNLIYNVLLQTDYKVICNNKGANLYTGLVSTMVDGFSIFKKNHYDYAIFEVDEGNVSKVMNELDNNYMVITNFFRDQLDRYSEIDFLINKIKDSLENKNVNVLYNSDDPFCMRFSQFNSVGFGFTSSIDVFEQGNITESKYCNNCGKELIYSHNFYNQLGHYACSCGFHRIEPKYNLSSLIPLTINNNNYDHNLVGNYNAYNLLAAVSLLNEIEINEKYIFKGLKEYHSTDGRMQLFNINSNNTYLNLVKNPAGMNMTIEEIINLKPKNVCFILNDNYGDGIDVSWIWDCEFERLLKEKINTFYVCGTRASEMGLRFKNMGVSNEKIKVIYNFKDAIDQITNKSSVIVSSYTALNETKNAILKKEGK